MEEDKANANSELRYIALELTKISKQAKKPFSSIAGEYVQNVFELETLLRNSAKISSKARVSAKKESGMGTRQKKNRD